MNGLFFSDEMEFWMRKWHDLIGNYMREERDCTSQSKNSRWEILDHNGTNVVYNTLMTLHPRHCRESQRHSGAAEPRLSHLHLLFIRSYWVSALEPLNILPGLQRCCQNSDFMNSCPREERWLYKVFSRVEGCAHLAEGQHINRTQKGMHRSLTENEPIENTASLHSRWVLWVEESVTSDWPYPVTGSGCLHWGFIWKTFTEPSRADPWEPRPGSHLKVLKVGDVCSGGKEAHTLQVQREARMMLHVCGDKKGRSLNPSIQLTSSGKLQKVEETDRKQRQKKKKAVEMPGTLQVGVRKLGQNK